MTSCPGPLKIYLVVPQRMALYFSGFLFGCDSTGQKREANIAEKPQIMNSLRSVVLRLFIYPRNTPLGALGPSQSSSNLKL